MEVKIVEIVTFIYFTSRIAINVELNQLLFILKCILLD